VNPRSQLAPSPFLSAPDKALRDDVYKGLTVLRRLTLQMWIETDLRTARSVANSDANRYKRRGGRRRDRRCDVPLQPSVTCLHYHLVCAAVSKRNYLPRWCHKTVA